MGPKQNEEVVEKDCAACENGETRKGGDKKIEKRTQAILRIPPLKEFGEAHKRCVKEVGEQHICKRGEFCADVPNGNGFEAKKAAEKNRLER